jgi:MFS family permease
MNALFPLGGSIGAIVSGFLADYFGRKNALLLINILVFITATYNLIAKYILSFELIMIARFISGVYCGLFSAIVPLYLVELPPLKYRFISAAFYQFFSTTGTLMNSIYGQKFCLGNEDKWPILAGAFLYLPCIAMLGLFFAVESPKHLYINKNDKKGAQEALVKLRGAENMTLVKRELELLENEKKTKQNKPNVSWLDLFRDKSLRHPLLIAFLMHFSQQFSGINVVMIQFVYTS